MAKWNLALNLSGVTVRDPTQVGLPTGLYKVAISDSDQTQSDDPSKGPTIKLTCVVQDGEHKGAEVFIWMGTDVSKKGVLRSWKTLLASIGAPAAMLEGALTIAPETLQGKIGTIYVRAKNPDEKDGYDQRDWVTEDMAKKIAATLAGTAGAPANGAGTAAQTPAAGGSTPQPTAQGAAGAAGGLRF